jgi:FdhE protein
VASDFVRKLLGRNKPLPAEVEDAIAVLTRLGQENPVVAELAGQVSACLSAAYTEPVQVAVPSITQEAATEKVQAGLPLLRGERLDIDWSAVQRNLQHVVGALVDRRPDAAPAVAEAARSGQLEIRELTAAVLAGQTHIIHQRAGALGLDVTLVVSVIPLVLFPVLLPVRVGLEPLLAAGHWQQGYCPICGSVPKLGEYRGLEQNRFLRCGICAADWSFPRLQCPACGNKDHRQLGYLHVDGEQNKCRAATCEECKQYVKMVSTLMPLPPLQLWVTDVATVHVDLLAADQGFSPPM